MIQLSTALLLAASHCPADDPQESYIDGSKPFVSIKDANRQGDAWGTCSAAYDITAELIEDQKPSQSRRLKDLSNGAQVAVMMLHFLDGVTSDITPEQFNTRWSYSKLLSETIPETQYTRILADTETLSGNNGRIIFEDRLLATVKICMDNLEGQQAYVDSWRDLAKSGLLTLPQD